MSANKHIPHVLVLPEDDANRQLANGFLLHPKANLRSIQVLPEAGGWHKVRDSFAADHCRALERYRNRRMILLVDFDSQADRLAVMKEAIPQSLQDRVFVLGVWSEPEHLRTLHAGTLEEVGEKLANECHDEREQLWIHDLLRHNRDEIARMGSTVRGILFSA